MFHLIRDLRELHLSRWELFRIFAATVLFALFEGLGIGMLVSILEYIERDFTPRKEGAGGLLLSIPGSFGIPEGPLTVGFLLALAFLALFVRSVLHYFRDIDAARLKFRTGERLRAKGFEAFIRADLTFLNFHSIGSLIATLTSEVDRAAEALASRVVLLTALLLAATYIALLFLLAPQLALLCLPVFVLIALAFRYQSRLSASYGGEVSRANMSFSSFLSDQLRGIARIKMRVQEMRATRDIETTIKSLYMSLFRIEQVRVLVEIGTFPLLVLLAFLLLFVAVSFLQMTLAALGMFMFILVRLAPQVTLVNSLWSHTQGCMASYVLLEEMIRAARQSREVDSGSRPFAALRRSIEFKDVCFRYPGSQGGFELKGVSFSIPRGSLTALVGRSGGGKSTLLRLLTRFYSPSSGQILLDDVPYDELRLSDLRRAIALVPQEAHLFDDTVRSNVTYGINRSLSEGELHLLLDKTRCLDFVSKMDRELDARIGEGGNRLSGGQRQRLAIAHALAALPEIFILDEPTSALDSESEKAIQLLLTEEGRRGATILVIAHRLSTIRNADQIIVLDQGRVAGIGRHEELLNTCGTYRTLFQHQLLAEV